MSPFVAALLLSMTSVNCPCGRSSRSWQSWDLNPLASSPRSTQRSRLLIKPPAAPIALGRKTQILPLALPVSAPARVSALQPHGGMGLSSSKARGPSCVRAFAHAFPSFFLPSAAFQCPAGMSPPRACLPRPPQTSLGPPARWHQASSWFIFTAHVICN